MDESTDVFFVPWHWHLRRRALPIKGPMASAAPIANVKYRTSRHCGFMNVKYRRSRHCGFTQPPRKLAGE